MQSNTKQEINELTNESGNLYHTLLSHRDCLFLILFSVVKLSADFMLMIADKI